MNRKQPASHRKPRADLKPPRYAAQTEGYDPPEQSLVSIEDIFNDVVSTENYAVKILAEIREALGAGHKPMLCDFPELARRIRRGYDRYEKLRALNPYQFEKLWKVAQNGEKRFDELVDEIERKSRKTVV